MSANDDIKCSGKRGQVKLWYNEGDFYVDGDSVPPSPEGNTTYSIAMREGGFLNIKKSVLESWDEEAKYSPVFNKWGKRWTPNDKGVIGEPYLFEESRKERESEM